MPTTVADLLGTWQLVAWEIDVGGRLVQPFGPRPVGLLSYTPDGWMQATIAAAERPGLSGPSARSSPDAEVAATARTYFSYAGRWWLEPEPIAADDPGAAPDVDAGPGADADAGAVRDADDNVEVVCHEVVVALDPAMLGTVQRRRLHLEAGRLTLAAAEAVGTTTRHHRLVWQHPGAANSRSAPPTPPPAAPPTAPRTPPPPTPTTTAPPTPTGTT